MFAVGNKVTWTSQASGHTKTKSGTVLLVVPAGRLPQHVAGWDVLKKFGLSKLGHGSVRRHESYVVLVKKSLFWPRVCGLSMTELPVPACGGVR